MQAAAAYGLELQARSIAPLYHSSNGKIDSHRFLVGTSSFAGDNKIHVLEYQDETRLLECSTVWFHEEEVFGLWSSPSLTEPSLLAVSSPGTTRVFQVPETLSRELRDVTAFDVVASQVLWDLDGLQNEVRLTSQDTLRVYALGEGNAGKEVSRFCIGGGTQISCAALDAHHSSVCMVACEKLGLYLIDTRKKNPESIANTATLHGMGLTRCIDFSSCQMNLILTSGDDGCVLWHDLRMSGTTCCVERRQHLQAHNHAVPRALLNPFRDELLISCSSDHTLKLWDSSKQGDDHEPAVCLKKLADFGDSVVDACWSSGAPWVFAGVSYNGRVLVDDVPKEKKMAILLNDG
ncbi:WD40 repeat protein [Trypanosoma rangeli]|uniref:WD40 repeat protein n=1 Tax=Trypanosoma rangeli TaxID=5698 RepID=A0A422NSA5_TRYRA|nr:WD40 repeat protein [Trypanosoma rangeli]RNF08343.1 WD40 repeat protein [Trypanosoma rangeli]|eukprot:RNF08343.1 WD40 repeat protein [Trypanosoma rangeli]